MRPESLGPLIESRKQYYGEMFRRMALAKRLYRHDFAGLTNIPADIRAYESSTASIVIDTYRNQIRTDEPTVQFEAYGPSNKAQTHATLMTRWGYGQLAKERARNAIDPNEQCKFDAGLLGAACKKILVDVDVLPGVRPRRGTKASDEYDAYLATYWPYLSRAVDPMSVLPSPTMRTPLLDIIELQSRRAVELWEQYPYWTDPRKNSLSEREATNPDRIVEWAEYWSAPIVRDGKVVEAGAYIVEADGERIIDKDNPYGFVPYIYRFSGLGRVDSEGDPSELAVGLLTGFTGDIISEVEQMTAIGIQTLMHVFPTVLTTEDPKAVAKQFAVGPGRVIQHPPGNPPVYMQPPPPNENLYRFLEIVRSNIARMQSDALRGGRSPGVEFGILQAQLVGQALTSIRPIREAVNDMAGQTLNMMARMMRTLDMRMTVEGTAEPAEPRRTVDGDDFTHFNFSVEFEAVDPSENDRLLLVGMSAYRGGALSLRTLWKTYMKAVVPDPEEEETQMWAERVIAQLFESGQLTALVLSEDQRGVVEEQVAQTVAGARQMVGEMGGGEVSMAADQRAREMEALSGTPGGLSVPREIAQEAERGSTRG